MRQREDAQDDVQTVADESKVVEEQVDKTMKTSQRSRGFGHDHHDHDNTKPQRVGVLMTPSSCLDGA